MPLRSTGFIRALADLVYQRYSSSRTGALDPTAMKSAISQMSGRFSGYSQEVDSSYVARK